MSIEQREQLAAIVPFLPAGARVLNLGFSPDIFAQGLANDCHAVRISAGAGRPASADAAVDMLPEDCYAVMCAPLAADRGGARLLRSVAAANAPTLVHLRWLPGHHRCDWRCGMPRARQPIDGRWPARAEHLPPARGRTEGVRGRDAVVGGPAELRRSSAAFI